MDISFEYYITTAIFLLSFLIYVKRPVPVYLKFFPLYLFLLLITDIILDYTGSKGIHNNILSNSDGIAEFYFYSFVIRKVTSNPKVKKINLFTSLCFTLFALINLFFVQGYDLFNPVNFTIGSVITVVFCIYYFVELFQRPQAPSLVRLPSFWIVSGILFSVVLNFPIFALLSFMSSLSKENLATSQIIFNNINSIFDIISVFTYVLYLIGFLCRIEISNSTLSS